TPHKGGQTHLGKPVFDTVADAVKATKADVSLIFVPAFAVGDSVVEAADAGIKLAVVITEHTPVKDMMFAKQYANKKGMKIIG
ncbi:succinate--CoA ligase subunit alpha, partial [Campylobacter jejuni]